MWRTTGCCLALSDWPAPGLLEDEALRLRWRDDVSEREEAEESPRSDVGDFGVLEVLKLSRLDTKRFDSCSSDNIDELSEPRSSTCSERGDVTRAPAASADVNALSPVELRRCGGSASEGEGLRRARLTAVMPRRGCRECLLDSDVADDVSKCCVDELLSERASSVVT